MDNFGRDVLDRLIFGSRVALGIGAMATLLNMAFGGFLGLIGGYFRGAADAYGITHVREGSPPNCATWLSQMETKFGKAP